MRTAGQSVKVRSSLRPLAFIVLLLCADVGRSHRAFKDGENGEDSQSTNHESDNVERAVKDGEDSQSRDRESNNVYGAVKDGQDSHSNDQDNINVHRAVNDGEDSQSNDHESNNVYRAIKDWQDSQSNTQDNINVHRVVRDGQNSQTGDHVSSNVAPATKKGEGAAKLKRGLLQSLRQRSIRASSGGSTQSNVAAPGMEGDAEWRRDFRLRQGQAGKIVVLIADYDGCFDFLNPLLSKENQRKKDPANLSSKDLMSSPACWEHFGRTPHIKHERQKLIAYLKQITGSASRVILFVGSARQSLEFDGDMAWGTRRERFPTSAAIRDGGFEAMADELSKPEDLDKKVELNKALLADHFHKQKSVPSRMDMATWEPTDFANVEQKAWTDKTYVQPWMPPPHATEAQQSDFKLLIIKNIMRHVADVASAEPTKVIEAYFFDDKPRFLDHTAGKLNLDEPLWGTSAKEYANIWFFTVLYDYRDCSLDGEDYTISRKEGGRKEGMAATRWEEEARLKTGTQPNPCSSD